MMNDQKSSYEIFFMAFLSFFSRCFTYPTFFWIFKIGWQLTYQFFCLLFMKNTVPKAIAALLPLSTRPDTYWLISTHLLQVADDQVVI